MTISNPQMLHLIWLVMLLFFVAAYGLRKRFRMITAFMEPSMITSMIPDYSPARRWTKALLLTAALLFIVLSLAGPQVGFRWETVEQKGVDIMIALDCSRSMLATDIKPSRLEQAKREIIDLLNMMQSDRAGLVAFAGSAALQCPLTLDHSAFHIFLKALNPDYLPRGGTDIRGAIQTALNGFESDVNSEKAIILITDGENTSGDPMEIVKQAVTEGVKIFCIGVGSETGAPVPDGAGGFKKDKQGRIIMSKVDDDGLTNIAAMGTGKYVKSVAGDMDLDLIYTREIQKNMEKTTIQSGRKKVWENRFQWLLFPAVVLLILELFISEGRQNRLRKQKNKLFAFPLLILVGGLFCLTETADAGTYSSVKQGIEDFEEGRYEQARKNFIDAQLQDPEMPELYYNIGSAAYKTGKFEEALNNFTRALDTEDPVLKDQSRFNLGNTKYRMGDFEGAIEAFQEIGTESRLHKKASDNIEFVKKVMEEQKRQQEQQQNQQCDNKNQKNQEQKENDANQDQKKGKNTEQDQQKGDNQSKDKQDKQDGEKKENPQQEQKSNQDKSNSDPQKQKGREHKQDQGQDQKKNGQGAHPQPESQKEQKDQQNQNAQAASATGPSDDQRKQGHQRLLNRLEDKPGAAMVPVYSGQPVEKDW